MQTSHAADPPWRDHKRGLWPLGLMVTALPVIGAPLAQHTGVTLLWFLLPVYAYGLVPVLDVLLGEDTANPPDDRVPALEADPYYRIVLLVFVPLQYAVFSWGAYTFVQGGQGIVAQIGLILSIGMIGGAGINVAHEIGHQPGRLNGWLAKLALAQTGYGHFYVEHNRGHHVRVATPEDPASARLGESYYGFWQRTVAGGLQSAWALERRRLASLGKPTWAPANHLLQAWALTLLLLGTVLVAFGPGALLFWLAQAFVGFSLLEGVNYVEHYGLMRARDSKGRWERVRPRHSWNSNHVMSNLMLYHLQRHSDHHAHWTRRYQALRHQPEAPALPAGYTAMLLLALCPPLWRRVMDPRVLAHYGGDATLANRGQDSPP